MWLVEPQRAYRLNVSICCFRTLVFPNGSLEINVTALKDSGNFTCIASNAAGESTGRVELVVTAMPHLANSTSRSRDQSSEPAPSDILTSSKVALSNNETRGSDRRVSLVELTGNSALIRWSSQTPISGVRMFQVQYNSSGDDTLVYRSVFVIIQCKQLSRAAGVSQTSVNRLNMLIKDFWVLCVCLQRENVCTRECVCINLFVYRQISAAAMRMRADDRWFKWRLAGHPVINV